MKTVSILIIDDEFDNFDIIETLLKLDAPHLERHYNYKLHYVSSGSQAIASLDNYQPDLILLDVMMPEIDGITVCQQIKAMPKWQTIPIIMVTALNSKTTLAHCLNAGADDFLSKPVVALELRARINSMLRIKQQYDDIQSLSTLQNNSINVLESTLSMLQGNLATTLAHELKTPVQGMLGTLDMLMHYREQMNAAEIDEALGMANNSAQRLKRLVQKFLLYLELELSTNQQHPVTVSKTKLSSEALQNNLRTQSLEYNRQADLIFDIEEAEVSISERYLSIIFRELLENALKFSPPKTIINVSSRVLGDMLSLSIHDFGRGMTAEQLSKIGVFIQFERENYEQQGSGMGLKLVKKMVEIAEGQFSIASTYKKETIVNIKLPIVQR